MPFRYRAAVLFFLLNSAGAFGGIDRLLYGEWDGKPGDKFTQFMNAMQIAVSVWLFARGYAKTRTLLPGDKLLLTLSLFLLASELWSFQPETSIRRGVIYLFVIVAVIGIAKLCDGDELMDLVMAACIMSTFCSLLLYAIAPSQALMPEDPYGLRGLFAHKNVLGQVMAVSILVALHQLRCGRRKRLHAVALLVFLVVCALSKSGTSAIVSLFFCGLAAFMALMKAGPLGRAVALLLAAAAVPLLAVLILAPDLLLEAAGKDPTLTGRTDLWVYVLEDIAQKPLLGWGFAGFWSSDNPAADEISTILGWVVPEAHNGLLEILLELGVAGAVLFLSLLARYAMIGVNCLRTSYRQIAISLLLCLAGLVMVGVTEEVLLDPSQMFVPVLFMMSLICERALKERAQASMRVRAFNRAGHPAVSTWANSAAGHVAPRG